MPAAFAVGDDVALQGVGEYEFNAPPSFGKVLVVNGAGPWTYDLYLRVGTDGAIYALAAVQESFLARIDPYTGAFSITDLVMLAAPYSSLLQPSGSHAFTRPQYYQVVGSFDVVTHAGGVFNPPVSNVILQGTSGYRLYVTESSLDPTPLDPNDYFNG